MLAKKEKFWKTDKSKSAGVQATQLPISEVVQLFFEMIDRTKENK